MSSYHQKFVANSKTHLDGQTYDTLHKRSRAQAGGSAPRGRPVAYRLDKEFFPTQGEADDWMLAYTGEKAPVPQESDGEWTYVLAPEHGDNPTKTKGIAEGVTCDWARPINKGSESFAAKHSEAGALEALKSMWAATVKALTGTDLVEKGSPTTQSVHVPVPVNTESVPRKKGAKKGSKKGKKLVPPGTADVVPDGTEAINKASWAGFSRDLALRDGVEDEGLTIHLGCGADREPGSLGIDLHPRDAETLPHDLSLGIPLPSGLVKRVYIAKSALVGADFNELMAEVRRVAAPDAEVYSDVTLTVAHPVPPLEAEHHDPGIEAIERIEKRSNRANTQVPFKERLARIGDERRELVLKAMDRTVPIAGINRAKQIMYGPVLVPHEVHDSLDYMTPEDIEYTCHGYMQSSRMVGTDHTQEAITADVVESFIAPCDLEFDGSQSPYGAQTIPKGSWVAGVKIHDREVWEKVLDGSFTGFSTGGFGARKDLEFD